MDVQTFCRFEKQIKRILPATNSATLSVHTPLFRRLIVFLFCPPLSFLCIVLYTAPLVFVLDIHDPFANGRYTANNNSPTNVTTFIL